MSTPMAQRVGDRPGVPVESRHRIPLVGGLFRRLFMHHIVLVTVPVALLGILLVGIAGRAVQETVEDDNREIVLRAQGEIEGYATFLRDQLRLVAVGLERLEDVTADPEQPALDSRQAELFLNDARSAEGTTPFRNLYAVDAEGAMAATTDYTAARLPEGGEQVVNASLADSSFSTRVVRGARDQEAEGSSQLPTVLMGTPLTSSLGVKLGALLAVVNLDAIWAVIDSINVGERGRAFLVDERGVVIAHREKQLVYGEADYSGLLSVQRALGDSLVGQVAEELAPGDEERMMAAYAPIRAAGLGWGLVIHRPVAEVESTRATMTFRIFTVVLIGIALALISTLVYTRRLVRPLGALADGANRLSHGDLDYKIPVVGRDELGRLATDFNLMAEQISRIQERLRRVEHLDTLAKFSSVVAHEIRNPLNAMQINIHLLSERLDVADHEYLDIISSEIRRLENLVREFQNISRPPLISPERTDVNELISEVVNLEKSSGKAQGVAFELRLDPELPHVEADRNRIHQAVLNLVLNAMQSMPSGGTLRIGTSKWERTPGGICISISDTGQGIPREELGRVFDFYYTSRDSGSGLGLSVAQQIVDEHGGQITLASAVGEGTTAQMFLPPRPPMRSLPDQGEGN